MGKKAYDSKPVIIFAAAAFTVLLLLTVAWQGGWTTPTPQGTGSTLGVTAYQTYIKFENGEEKYIDAGAVPKGLMVVEGGGGATELGTNFRIYGTVYRDGSALTDVQISVSYTITATSEGKNIKSTTGTMSFYSGYSDVTSLLKVTETELRNALGTGTHTVTFTCSASATATPVSGVTLTASNSNNKAYSVNLSTYTMTITVS